MEYLSDGKIEGIVRVWDFEGQLRETKFYTEGKEVPLSECEMREVNASKMEQLGDLAYVVGERKPFTGTVTNLNEKGELKASADYKEGKHAGLAQTWCNPTPLSF